MPCNAKIKRKKLTKKQNSNHSHAPESFAVADGYHHVITACMSEFPTLDLDHRLVISRLVSRQLRRLVWRAKLRDPIADQIG